MQIINEVVMGNSLVEKIAEGLHIESGNSVVIMSIAIILFVGFLATRLTKLVKLPNVTAYIVVGILLVPIWTIIPAGIDGIIPTRVIDGMSFLTDIALAFIAFGAGEFFKIDVLKKSGGKVIVITIFEALMAVVVVFCLCFFVLRISLGFSMVLAALSSATAPASTIMTIKQTKAKGEYVNTLLQVVALDDVVSLLAFSVALALHGALSANGGASFNSIGLPILLNIACLALGFVFGLLLKVLLPTKRTSDNRLIIVIATLFLFCGICALMGQSPLLGCMAMGMTYINVSKDEKLFKQLSYFQPPIMLCFFVMSGMRFNLKSFTDMTRVGIAPLFVVSLVYFFARIIGKYLGAYLGGLSTKSDKKITRYLGLGLIPQAGVAIGLSIMGAEAIGGSDGVALQTIILASSVLYELVGPGSAKLGLYLSKSYSTDIDELVPQEMVVAEAETKNDVEILIEQINRIRQNIPTVDVVAEDEEAFTEAAEEYIEENMLRRKFINRR